MLREALLNVKVIFKTIYCARDLMQFFTLEIKTKTKSKIYWVFSINFIMSLTLFFYPKPSLIPQAHEFPLIPPHRLYVFVSFLYLANVNQNKQYKKDFQFQLHTTEL